MSEYPGFDPKSLTTTFSVVNDTYFKVSGTAVMLNAYETPSYIGQVTDVNAKVTATGFYTPAADKKIGTVTVTKTTKKRLLIMVRLNLQLGVMTHKLLQLRNSH